MTSDEGVELPPRFVRVNTARRDLYGYLWTFVDSRRLTHVEMLTLVTEFQQQVIRSMLLIERYPDDPEAKADEM